MLILAPGDPNTGRHRLMGNGSSIKHPTGRLDHHTSHTTVVLHALTTSMDTRRPMDSAADDMVVVVGMAHLDRLEDEKTFVWDVSV